MTPSAASHALSRLRRTFNDPLIELHGFLEQREFFLAVDHRVEGPNHPNCQSSFLKSDVPIGAGQGGAGTLPAVSSLPARFHVDEDLVLGAAEDVVLRNNPIQPTQAELTALVESLL